LRVELTLMVEENSLNSGGQAEGVDEKGPTAGCGEKFYVHRIDELDP